MTEQINLVSQGLDKDGNGNILSSVSNFVHILRNDENLKNIVYNQLQSNIDIVGKVPWEREKVGWNACDVSCLLYYIEKNYGVYSPVKCRDAIWAYLVSERKYHPIKEYLNCLQWDGEKRIDKLLVKYLGAEDTDYTRTITRKTLVAAVSRVMNPGVKFDTVLVLCGPQGIGKSTFFSKLGKGWYSDAMSISDMKDKTAAEKIQGIWIMEMGELAGLRKTDTEIIKSFLSKTNDRYRPTYGQYVENHLRSGIIVGTTNAKDGFLRDITGNRRFWTVICNGETTDKIWEITEEEIDQIWAEAVSVYKMNESIYLNKEMELVAQKEQKQALESDPRQGIVENYLVQSGATKVCLMQIWCECLKKERADMKRRDAFELESILLQIEGWETYKGNSTGKLRFAEYGVQKAFVKKMGVNVCKDNCMSTSVEQWILS